MTWFIPIREKEPSKSPEVFNHGMVEGENWIIKTRLRPAVAGAEKISVIGGIALGILGYQAVIFLSRFF